MLEQKQYKKLIIFCDGASKGNPGPAGIGVVIRNPDGFVVEKLSEYIGQQTNNQAEYHALILALEEARFHGAEEVDCFLDSELVAKQLKGEYKVKDRVIKSLFALAKSIVSRFKKVNFFHISREENEYADRLASEAIKEILKKNFNNI